jgi:hypothetical protein
MSSRFEIRIQTQEFKFEVSNLVWCGPIDSVKKFREFIGVEPHLTPKREFDPHGLLYRCKNLKKLWRSESICFMGANRSNQFNLQTENFPGFSLMFIPL